MRAELFLARRYLRPKRNEISIITIISIIGVMLGVAVLIVVLAVMTGFGNEMRSKMLQTQPHLDIVTLSPAGGVIATTNTAPVKQKITDIGGEAAEMIRSAVMVQMGKIFEPQYVIGIDPEAFAPHMDFKAALKSGNFDLNTGEIAISSEFASKFGLALGDRILVHSSTKFTEMLNISESGKLSIKENPEVILPSEFTIAGIFHFGKYDFDSQVLFMNINDAAELFNLPWNSATDVVGWVEDPENAAQYAKILKKELPYSIISTWEDSNRMLLNALHVEKNMMFFLLIFIVLVAAFSISNNLITSVYQKTREIGLLKALGASNWQLMRIFLFQGLLVGIFGTGCGVALGLLVIKFRMAIMETISRITGREMFPNQLYFFDELPAQVVPSDLMWIIIISVVLCTLGGLLPAWRAAKLDPAKAFRYE